MDYTTAWTIVGSIFAATFSQFLGYVFSKKREEKKFNKECFQKLYSPSVLSVSDLVLETGYFHIADINMSEVYVQSMQESLFLIFDIIEHNLEYATPELLNEYQYLKKYLDSKNSDTILSNKYDQFVWDKIIKFSCVYFRNYLSLYLKLKLTNTSTITTVKTTYFFCLLYELIINNYFGFKTQLTSHELMETYMPIEYLSQNINFKTIKQMEQLLAKLDAIFYQNTPDNKVNQKVNALVSGLLNDANETNDIDTSAIVNIIIKLSHLSYED